MCLNPIPTTTFYRVSSKTPELRTDPAQKKMKFPITVFHRNHTAKIYAKSPRDGKYRTSWYAEGKRVQRNFKKLTDAKAASLAALKSIARGESNQASLTPSKIREVKLAENALRPLGVTLLDAVTEYVAAKKNDAA